MGRLLQALYRPEGGWGAGKWKDTVAGKEYGKWAGANLLRIHTYRRKRFVSHPIESKEFGGTLNKIRFSNRDSGGR